METFAFVCAMPMELRPLTKRLDLHKDGALRRGTLGHRAVVAVATGMGTSRATQRTEALLDSVAVDRLLVFGITGAVDDEIAIGAVVRPERVVDSETGREHRPDQLGDEPAHGTMWTTNVITPPTELPALRARGVVCLDMETAAIAACCERRGIPWSVHRSISDRATDGALVEEAFRLSNQDGTPNLRAVAGWFLRHPHRIPAMAKMGKGAKLATERAADAAIAAARSLG